MRNFSLLACLATLVMLPTAALGMQVICPPLVRQGVTDLAAAYTRTTGIPVTVKAAVMGKIMGDIKTGPADVVLLPTGLMNTLAAGHGIKDGTRHKLGRVEIALAVRPGAPHPDISTVAKLASALRTAGAVAYTRPGPPRNSMEAGIIDGILHQPEFSGVRLKPMATGSGIAALGKGEADMALQVTPEIIFRKDVELVGPLPPELGAHIDVDAAVSAQAAEPEAASAFIRYLTGHQAAQDWKRFGLAPPR